MKIKYFIIGVSCALYVASLFQPAFICIKESALGYQILMFGWLGVFALDPRWFANFAFFYVIYCHYAKINSKKTNTTLGELSVIFMVIVGATTLFIFNPLGCPGLDTPTAVKGLDIGGYLWVASLLFLSISTILYGIFISKK